jgi:hypothetical protein
VCRGEERRVPSHQSAVFVLLRLRAACACVQDLIPALHAASAQLIAQLALSFFMPFCLTALALLARIRLLTCQLLLDGVRAYNTGIEAAVLLPISTRADGRTVSGEGLPQLLRCDWQESMPRVHSVPFPPGTSLAAEAREGNRRHGICVVTLEALPAVRGGRGCGAGVTPALAAQLAVMEDRGTAVPREVLAAAKRSDPRQQAGDKAGACTALVHADPAAADCDDIGVAIPQMVAHLKVQQQQQGQGQQQGGVKPVRPAYLSVEVPRKAGTLQPSKPAFVGVEVPTRATVAAAPAAAQPSNPAYVSVALAIGSAAGAAADLPPQVLPVQQAPAAPHLGAAVAGHKRKMDEGLLGKGELGSTAAPQQAKQLQSSVCSVPGQGSLLRKAGVQAASKLAQQQQQAGVGVRSWEDWLNPLVAEGNSGRGGLPRNVASAKLTNQGAGVKQQKKRRANR